MSYAIHAYFLDENQDEENVFDLVRNLFSTSERVECITSKNIFTKKDFLKLSVDKSYSISLFFDADKVVEDDLEFILKERLSCKSRLRVLFAPDPENNFDDIAVIILHYLENFKAVIIYSVNQDRVIFNALNK